MDENTRSIFLGLSVLYLIAVAALILTVSRSLKSNHPLQTGKMIQLFLIGIACQCFHFTEEFITGFYIRYPEFWGLQPWSPDFFIAFNLSWIAIWLFSAVGVQQGYRIAFFPVWFFAIGMLANLIGHPLLALINGGYFPGFISAPIVGIIGFLLIKRLFQLTSRAEFTQMSAK